MTADARRLCGCGAPGDHDETHDPDYEAPAELGPINWAGAQYCEADRECPFLATATATRGGETLRVCAGHSESAQ